MLEACPHLGRFVEIVDTAWDEANAALIDQIHLMPRLTTLGRLWWCPMPGDSARQEASCRPAPIDLTLNISRGRYYSHREFAPHLVHAALRTRLDLSRVRRLELRIGDDEVIVRSLELDGLALCLEDLTLSACIEHTYTELVRVVANPDGLRSLRLRSGFETEDEEVITPREDPLELRPRPLTLFPGLESLHIDFPPGYDLFADGHAALTTVSFLSYGPWFQELEPGFPFGARDGITRLCDGVASRPPCFPSLRTIVWHPTRMEPRIFDAILPDLRATDAHIREVGLAFQDSARRDWSFRLNGT
jgi:hypothetical protein